MVLALCVFKILHVLVNLVKPKQTLQDLARSFQEFYLG